MAADGSLRFDTAVNTEGFKDGISVLSKAMDRLTKAVDQLSSNIITRFGATEQAMQKVAEGAEKASEEIESIGSSADRSTERVKSLQEQMDAISVHTMQDSAADVATAAPVSVPVAASDMGYNPEAMSAVFGKAAEDIRSWSDAINMYGQQAGFALNDLERDAAEAGQAISSGADQAENTVQRYVGFKDSVIGAFKNMPGAFALIPKALSLEISKIPGIVKSGFSKASGVISGFGKALGKGLAGKAKSAVTSLKGLSKPADKAAKSILKLSNMFKLMLIRMAMRAVVQGVKEGMQNLVQYSGDANQAMSELTSSMTYAKNSFAAAFAPILSFVVPAITVLINALATAVGYVNQFFSALGGKGTFVRAKKVNQDYAASLKKTGGAAKQAGKDAKKALAPFDDLVQIQREGADDSSGGSSGGIDPSQMFETVAIDQGISDFANKLKELWQAGDWEGIGQLIGQKINDSVQKFTDYISWDNVGAKITTFVTAFTTLFNSLVANIDWYSIGIMMGTGINTLANTLYLLLTQIDWFMLGSALATGLNGMVATIDWNLFGATLGAFFQAKISGLYGFVDTADWPLIGQAIGNGLNGTISQIDWGMLGLLFATGLGGLFAIAGNFAQTFDWTGFGSSIALSLSTFFQTFDWAGSGTAISDFVLGLLNAFVTFIKETDWTALGTGVAEMALAIDWWGILLAVIDAVLQTLKAVVLASWGLLSEIGKSLWEGFCKGVKTFFSDPKAFIRDNIVDPFVKYFKELFGIHSPSTVMAEMGQYLWDGFCNGIKEFFSNPGAFIKANITDPFVNGLKSLLGIHSPSTVLAGIGSYTVQGFNQGVTSEQTASQNVVQSWASGVANWFSEKFGIGTGDSVESKKWANSIMSGFNNTVRKNYTQSQTVMETWAENVRKWFVGVDENQGVNELSWTKFADLIIQAFKAKIEGSHSETQGPVETWARNVREWFWGDSDPQGTGGMYAAFYDMAKRINEGFANGISDFAYMAKDAIRKWAAEAMEEAEEEFDINSPSREFYNIAEYVVRGFNNGIADMARSSRSIVQDWLDGVMDVFDGVQIRLPIGIDIPNAAAYLPKMARGSIVPPRAGDMAASMRSRSYAEEELLSNLIARLDALLSQQQGDRSQPIQIVLNLTGSMAALARALKPELDREAARRGVSLVVIGGT
ncbi:MAG: hypothetical protein ACLTGZ_13960 [Clostridium sp.]